MGGSAPAAASRIERPEALGRADWLALGAIVAFAVLLPAVLAGAAGALDIPHNDDFDSRRVAETLWATGQLEMRGYSVMALIGHVVAVQPLLWLSGGAPWAFAATTALFSVIGLASAYLVVRRVLGPARTTLAILAVVVVPGFLINTTSFMTDVPAMATAFACLALGSAAIEPGGHVRGRLLAAALIVGLFAVSIREFALGAPIAVAVVAAPADRRGPRRLAIAGVAVLATVAALHLLGGQIPGQGETRFDPGPGLLRLRQAFSTLALALAPALVVAIAWWRGRWLLRDLVPGLAVGMVVAWVPLTSLASTGRLPIMLIGNLFTLIGPDGNAALDGSRPLLYPNVVWSVVQAAAFAATILMPAVATGILGSIIRRGGVSRARVRDWARSPASLLVVFTLLTGLGLVVYGWAFTMFDRYLWPLIVSGSALLLIRPASMAEPDEPVPEATAASELRPLPALALSVALLAALAGLSVMNLLASNAFSAARWQFGEQAVALGIPAGSVDAGMEWVGYHAVGEATPFARPIAGRMWYTTWWPSYRQCAVVTSRPRTNVGFELVTYEPDAYRQFQLAGPGLPLYLYRVSSPDCP